MPSVPEYKTGCIKLKAGEEHWAFAEVLKIERIARAIKALHASVEIVFIFFVFRVYGKKKNNRGNDRSNSDANIISIFRNPKLLHRNFTDKNAKTRRKSILLNLIYRISSTNLIYFK